MKTNILILFIFIAMAGLSSCYYDKGDVLYPGAGLCDTSTVVSYAAKVVPILQQQCYSCHTTGSAGGGIIMGTYATDKAIAINGKLFGSITHSSGFLPMPQSAAKMSSCNISTIKKWIDAGSANN